MKTTRRLNLIAAALVGTLVFTATIARAADPLPSWNDGKAKQSIVAFVEKVTKEGTPNYVAAAYSTTTVRFGRSSRCISSCSSRLTA